MLGSEDDRPELYLAAEDRPLELFQAAGIVCNSCVGPLLPHVQSCSCDSFFSVTLLLLCCNMQAAVLYQECTLSSIAIVQRVSTLRSSLRFRTRTTGSQEQSGALHGEKAEVAKWEPGKVRPYRHVQQVNFCWINAPSPIRLQVALRNIALRF